MQQVQAGLESVFRKQLNAPDSFALKQRLVNFFFEGAESEHVLDLQSRMVCGRNHSTLHGVKAATGGTVNEYHCVLMELYTWTLK